MLSYFYSLTLFFTLALTLQYFITFTLSISQIATLHKKKEMDATNFLQLFADGQLLIYVAHAASPSIRYLWSIYWCYLKSKFLLENLKILHVKKLDFIDGYSG